MKIMFLNIWGARLYEGLLRYVRNMASEIDIFCFTEIHNLNTPFNGPVMIEDGKKGAQCLNSYSVIKRELGHEFEGWFSPERSRAVHDILETTLPVCVGSAIFWRNTLCVYDNRTDFINGSYNTPAVDGTKSRVMQSVAIDEGGTRYLLSHFHGLWTRNGKVDTDGRHWQSFRINKALGTLAEYVAADHIILGGDMNFDRNNAVLAALEKADVFGSKGARNLIKEKRITSTRTPMYRHLNTKNATQYADWLLVDRQLPVKQFFVPDQPIVSDHRPLVLTI